MELHVRPSGSLTCGVVTARCALGRSGIRANKHEGDGATPAGVFTLRHIYYRADRATRPISGLAVSALTPHDGWCDDPNCVDYNHRISLPHAGSHERMWRDDPLYDVLAVIGYNDAPPVRGLGSAIFLHVAAEGYALTEGCVALAREYLLAILAACDAAAAIRITTSE